MFVRPLPSYREFIPTPFAGSQKDGRKCRLRCLLGNNVVPPLVRLLDTWPCPEINLCLRLSECGHAFCEDCLAGWFQRFLPVAQGGQGLTGGYTCPHCRTKIYARPVEVYLAKQVVRDVVDARGRLRMGEADSDDDGSEVREEPGRSEESRRILNTCFQRFNGRDRRDVDTREIRDLFRRVAEGLPAQQMAEFMGRYAGEPRRDLLAAGVRQFLAANPREHRHVHLHNQQQPPMPLPAAPHIPAAPRWHIKLSHPQPLLLRQLLNLEDHGCITRIILYRPVFRGYKSKILNHTKGRIREASDTPVLRITKIAITMTHIPCIISDSRFNHQSSQVR